MREAKAFVPKLRFPEFRDTGEWSTPRGDTLFDSINNRRAAAGLPVLAITQEHGAIPREQIDYHVSVTAKSVASYKEVCEGDFIISLRSFQGGIEHSRYHGICSPAYVILRKKNGGNDNFFRHLFKSDRFIQQLTRNIEGIRDGKMISYAQFSEQLLPVPEPPEQQKIADCLDSLDDLIAAEGRKLEALRRHKQGLMQQLFPQPGESVPRLRFKEFWRAGDWKRDQIGNVASITKGKGISKADIEKGGAIPCIRYAELYTHYGEVIHEVVSSTNVPQGNLILSYAEDVIVPASGETKADIAKATCVLAEGVALGSDLNVLRSELYDPFLSYLLNSPLRHKIARVAQGDTVAHLYPKQISQVQLAYPSRLEQKKIAACLSSLDDLIAAKGRKLEALRQHKQGLMQQLFPVPERQ